MFRVTPGEDWKYNLKYFIVHNIYLSAAKCLSAACRGRQPRVSGDVYSEGSLVLMLSGCRESEGIFRQVRARDGGDGDEGPHHQALQGLRLRHLLRHGRRGESDTVRDSQPGREED